jgi:hypothetical protein
MIKKITILQNAVEAVRISEILNVNAIPHMIKSFHDSAYDGLWQTQWGWGALEADEADEPRILALLEEMHPDQSSDEHKA